MKQDDTYQARVLSHRPTVLIVLDGWGVALPSQANAITTARTPNFDSFVSRYPTFTLQASGEATGLPWSEVGNSEVGHMSIGAGRIVYQELSRINNAISDGSFSTNPALHEAIEHARKTAGTLHLIGMISSGGVHSHIDHIFALLELCRQQKVAKIAIHGILDGRDTPFASGKEFLEKVIAATRDLPHCVIGSLSGRFWAMDRDNHWDRIEKAYHAMTGDPASPTDTDPIHAVETSYQSRVWDEEFAPVAIVSKTGECAGAISSGDACIFFNIRADRARQLTHCFVEPNFSKFSAIPFENLMFVTLTQYEDGIPVRVAFEPQDVRMCLSEVVAKAGLVQLHIAETEKYAHVTYFFNGGKEEPFRNEQRILIPSQSVSSYDAKPEMSAREITDVAIRALQSDANDFVVINFANADMIGHTGNLKASVKAVEVIDQCLGLIVPVILAKKGAVIITADHGNAEMLIDIKTGSIDKEHSNNPVPCIVIAKELDGKSFTHSDVDSKNLSVIDPSGILSDVAPTALSLLGLAQPDEMTGKSLLNQ